MRFVPTQYRTPSLPNPSPGTFPKTDVVRAPDLGRDLVLGRFPARDRPPGLRRRNAVAVSTRGDLRSADA